MEDSESHRIRLAAFNWLQKIAVANEYVMDWQDLSKSFIYKGQVIPLIGPKGIWKPKGIRKYPISIATVSNSPYKDKIIGNNTLSYSYRGDDPMHPDNIGLREAKRAQIPLIYLHQVIKGRYFVAWPVFVVDDNPSALKFTISVESGEVINDEKILSEPSAQYRREYQTREVIVRLHQKSFREQVLKAYREHCAICNLKHRSLLDAAHIIPDSEGGSPVVSNGLSLCKIHHAAYDQNIIGISPDYKIEVREDILEEIDGPMLRYGLQETHNKQLILPRSLELRPNQEWLDVRYQRFKKIG